MTETDLQADENPSGFRAALSLLYGPIVWALHLAFVYALHGSACERAGSNAPLIDPGATPGAIAAATLGALVLLFVPLIAPNVLTGFRSQRSKQKDNVFYARVTRTLSILSAAGVIWAGSAAAIFEVCVVLQ